jgi:hypothetical protein
MEIGTDCQYETREDVMLVKIPKALLVFTQREVFNAIKRGKAWRRRGNYKMTKRGDGKIPELYR